MSRCAASFSLAPLGGANSLVPRTVASGVTNRKMWRRLLCAAHPDGGGTDDLFALAKALHDHIAVDEPEEAPRESRRDPRATGRPARGSTIAPPSITSTPPRRLPSYAVKLADRDDKRTCRIPLRLPRYSGRCPACRSV